MLSVLFTSTSTQPSILLAIATTPKTTRISRTVLEYASPTHLRSCSHSHQAADTEQVTSLVS